MILLPVYTCIQILACREGNGCVSSLNECVEGRDFLQCEECSSTYFLNSSNVCEGNTIDIGQVKY
eukprot:Awhi_evm2s6981